MRGVCTISVLIDCVILYMISIQPRPNAAQCMNVINPSAQTDPSRYPATARHAHPPSPDSIPAFGTTKSARQPVKREKKTHISHPIRPHTPKPHPPTPLRPPHPKRNINPSMQLIHLPRNPRNLTRKIYLLPQNLLRDTRRPKRIQRTAHHTR